MAGQRSCSHGVGGMGAVPQMKMSTICWSLTSQCGAFWHPPTLAQFGSLNQGCRGSCSDKYRPGADTNLPRTFARDKRPTGGGCRCGEAGRAKCPASI